MKAVSLMSSQHLISVRRWSPGDGTGVWDVLCDGSFSLINSTFRVCLRKRLANAIFITIFIICLILQVPFKCAVLAVGTYIFVLYIFSVLGAYVYLYGSTLNDIKDIAVSYFEHSGQHFWVAVCDGEIAGTIAIVKKTTPLKGSPQDLYETSHFEENIDDQFQVAWLRRMAVKRKFRGLGIARKLVREAISFCKQSNYNQIFLITTEVHDAARSLYSKLGFHLSAVVPYRYMYGFVTVKTFEYIMDL